MTIHGTNSFFGFLSPHTLKVKHAERRMDMVAVKVKVRHAERGDTGMVAVTVKVKHAKRKILAWLQ